MRLEKYLQAKDKEPHNFTGFLSLKYIMSNECSYKALQLTIKTKGKLQDMFLPDGEIHQIIEKISAKVTAVL